MSDRLHPESIRALRELITLHGADRIVEAVEGMARDMDRVRPERHPDEDDGRTYGDPRDEMAERLDRD